MFKLKEVVCFFSPLMWFRSLLFLFFASVQLHQLCPLAREVGGAGAGAVAAAAAAAAALAGTGLDQVGLFPKDDIIPFSELMSASGAWHMRSSHLQAEGFGNFDVLFRSHLLLCVFLS